MKFELIDQVLEQTDTRIVAVKAVTRAEEYLADHFPTFPVLPGVMMIETLVQAARIMLSGQVSTPLVLGSVKALRYGSFVRPGDTLQVEVNMLKAGEDGTFACKGSGIVLRATGERDGAPFGDTAVAGRFMLRQVRRPIPQSPSAASSSV